MHELPPPTEIFTGSQLSQRHPDLLPRNRLLWAARNRDKNGLAAAGAVFESPVGELLFHEPMVLRWLLGLTGRRKPRALRCRQESHRYRG
jgi:hypothetical protein